MLVPKVWRSSWKVMRWTSARSSACLKRGTSFRAIERLAGLRMAEHEIAIVGVVGALAQVAERERDPLGHRHRPARPGRLRVAELAADEGGDHADLARVEVDVAPTEPEQLALPEARHRCGQVQGRLDPPERIGCAATRLPA
jgi:hypothetical protein